MNSILNYPDLRYDKEFVSKTILYIQNNNSPILENKKKIILNKISKLRSANHKSESTINTVIDRHFRILKKIEKQQHEVNKLKWDIYYMMKKIVIKNIHNYQKLCRNSNLGMHFDGNCEIESECFLIFENCIYKFLDNDGNNDFYFYFNKSLSRSLYKVFLNNLKDDDKMSNISSMVFENQNHDDVIESLSNFYSEGLSMDFLLSNFKFDDISLKLIHSKLRGEKLSDFYESNPDFSQKDYDKTFKQIKKILKNEF